MWGQHNINSANLKMNAIELFYAENQIEEVHGTSYAVEYHFWASDKIDQMIQKIVDLTTKNTNYKCEVSKSDVSLSKYLNIGVMDEEEICLERYITIRFSDHKTPNSCYSALEWSWNIGNSESAEWIYNEFIKNVEI